MAIEIFNFRLSFIWTETLVQMLDEPPPDLPFAFLGRNYTYEPVFNACQQGQSGPDGLHLPWPVNARFNFWNYYFEGRQLAEVTGRQAWKALLPFRWLIPATLQADWLAGRILAEGFFYPHGLGLILTISCSRSLSLAEMVETGFQIRQREPFEIEWADHSQESLKCDQFANKCLNLMRTRAFGNSASQPKNVVPFSVFTVVQTNTIEPDQAMPNQVEIQRVLEAVTGWRHTWKNDPLPDFDTVKLDTRTAPPNHVVYSSKRGRAVWFPTLAELRDPYLHSLGCYHRNLVLASLGVESLVEFLKNYSQDLADGLEISAPRIDCAQRATGILSRFYYGKPSIYRTWSARAQLDQNQWVELLTQMRTHFNMNPD
jgi:hypothetical protein